MQITAAVMEKADGALTRRTIKLEEVELEGPREDEVLVRIHSCGVCGTDRGCIHGLEPFPTPGVLGHEGAGIVEEVGSRVTGVRPGDRVMIGFPYCGRCRWCRGGNPRYCEQGKELMFGGFRLDGSTPMKRAGGEPLAGRFFQQSSWATHAIALERQLAKVPDGLDLDQAGPYGCSISTGAGAVLNELRPRPGSSIAIFGAGNVGLAAVMAARLTGATTIIAIDRVPERLALARELGATHTLEHGAATVAELKELTKGALDYSIEATDGSNLVAEAVAALGILGVCAMVGGAKMTASVKVNHPDVLLNGKRIIGVLGGGGHTPDFLVSLMELQRDGRFPLDKLIRFYDFADVNQAIDDSDSGRTVKPVLRMAV
ncbi:NAD(P)-dependent alcohol dehydrogenase [Longimicrobium terrae]|uniref:Aryl-alcohol dehydrogenase n=1 Tax=Longimicrobium terrae TaxID=1639882 RepID=A0A841H3C7_9BACT|nr:NAD(P)-dependent alcohol dehydrogenase [Longimicrobium terrae]MBB4638080.1 aryl-alcohol dehydrogenase [Longimicrobium terrae]MBB6072452.1 aryl-alcohol dehydrogenase [Longimicrobium terrae]NNC32136.1 NAD(P)-dependent alcohol dehydrogenase [Longimicrobium terrae]